MCPHGLFRCHKRPLNVVIVIDTFPEHFRSNEDSATWLPFFNPILPQLNFLGCDASLPDLTGKHLLFNELFAFTVGFGNIFVCFFWCPFDGSSKFE
jgi:hypothetical protein